MTIEALYRQLLPFREQIGDVLVASPTKLSSSRLFVLSALFVLEGGANNEIRDAAANVPHDLADPELSRLRHKKRIGEVMRPLRRLGLITHTDHGVHQQYTYHLAPRTRRCLENCLAHIAA